VHMKKKQKSTLTNRFILGFQSWISTTLMYDNLTKKYGSKAKLLMTDTDSLMYEIETEDFFEDIRDDAPVKFDTSNFPADHPLDFR